MGRHQGGALLYSFALLLVATFVELEIAGWLVLTAGFVEQQIF